MTHRRSARRLQQSGADWKIYRDDTVFAFYQWARDMELADIPDQPDGIDTESHDRPDPAKAAERILAYVASFGDGLYDVADGNPLYGRDLEVVAKALTGRVVVDLPEPDEAYLRRSYHMWLVDLADGNRAQVEACQQDGTPEVWLERAFSPVQARSLAACLLAAADRAEQLADEAGAAQQDAQDIEEVSP